MACPICDQKPMNCDCTQEEKRQWLEIEGLRDEVASLRLTSAEREAIEDGIRCCEYIWAYKPSGEAGTRADLFASASALRGLLERTKGTGQ